MKKQRRWGYVLVCDGCCADIRLGAFEGPPDGCNIESSYPIFPSQTKALEEGKLAATAYPYYTYRVFTYEMK